MQKQKLNEKGSRCLLEWPEILRTNEQRNAIFRLRAWFATVLRIFSATSVTSELYGHTRFTLFCYYLEERNEGLPPLNERSILPS